MTSRDDKVWLPARCSKGLQRGVLIVVVVGREVHFCQSVPSSISLLDGQRDTARDREARARGEREGPRDTEMSFPHHSHPAIVLLPPAPPHPPSPPPHNKKQDDDSRQRCSERAGLARRRLGGQGARSSARDGSTRHKGRRARGTDCQRGSCGLKVG